MRLFCLHGWGFSSKVFKGLSCISLDLPAHGSSKLIYKDLHKLTQDIAIRIPKDSIILGWSMGASLGMLLALYFPQKVKGLILIGATPCFKKSWEEKNIRAFLLRLKREGMEFLREFRKRAYPFEFEEKIELNTAQRMLEDYINLDLTYLLPFVRKKAVVVHGERDSIVPISSGIALYNLIKGSKFITFQGGHFPKEYGYIINKVLKGF